MVAQFPDTIRQCELEVRSNASADQCDGSKSRPRPFGSGRLFLWRLLQDIEPADCHGDSRAGVNSALVRSGLDPAIEHLAPDVLTMAFGSIARFRISFDDQTVRLVDAHPEADQNTIDHFVDDHIAPRIIAAGGDLVLHGSAVVIGGRLAMFLGQTGAGKSTLAASLHAAGQRLKGDDAVVISETTGILQGEATYTSLRLFRESIEQVFRDDVTTSAMAFYSDKLHVSAPGWSGSVAERFALGAFYILKHSDADITIARMSPADSCMALVENSFALDPNNPASAAKRMARAARVAALIPCYKISYPRDFRLLGAVHSQIFESLIHPTDSA